MKQNCITTKCNLERLNHCLVIFAACLIAVVNERYLAACFVLYSLDRLQNDLVSELEEHSYNIVKRYSLLRVLLVVFCVTE